MMWFFRFRIQRSVLQRASLVIIAGLVFAGCAGTPTPDTTPTPWPTLAPLGANTSVSNNGTPRSGPRLIQHFKVEVNENGAAIFPIPGQPDRPVRVEVIILSGKPDPFVDIQNNARDILAGADRGGPGEPEVIGQFQFPKADYFQLAIGSNDGEGQLGVSIYELDPAMIEGGGSFSAIPGQIDATIRQPASYQSYHLPLQRGQRVDLVVRAVTDGLNLQFDLYDPDGALLDTRAIGEDREASLWNFMPRFTGQYTVVVSNIDEHIGDYSILVDPSTSGGQALLNQRTGLTLGAVGEKSIWLTFDSAAYDGVVIEVRPTGGAVDPVVEVYDQFGNRVATGTTSGQGQVEKLELVQLPFDGTYQVEFASQGEAGPVDYLIRKIRQVDAAIGGQIYPGGRAEKGDIYGVGMVITYFFEAKEGDLIGIDAHGTGGTGLDLGFDLYGPDGSRLLTRDDVVGKDPILDRFAIPLTGRYVIALWNFENTIGPFEIYVTTPEAPATPPPA